MPYSSEHPQFIEVKPGVFIAENVAVPSTVAIREQQHLLDQPPYHWLLAEPNLVEDRWQLSAEEEAKLAVILLRILAKKRRFFPVKFYTTKVDREKKFGEVNIHGGVGWFKDIVKKLIKPKLSIEMNTQLNDDSISLLRTINVMEAFLREYPYSIAYLLQYLVEPDFTVFDFFGNPHSVSENATFSIPSYAAFALNRSNYDKDWSNWVGLGKELPDDRAALVYDQRNQPNHLPKVPLLKTAIKSD